MTSPSFHRGARRPPRGVRSAVAVAGLLLAAGCGRGPAVEGWIRIGGPCEIRSGTLVARGESPGVPERIAWAGGGAPRVAPLTCTARGGGGEAVLDLFVGDPSESLPTGSFPIGRDLLSRRSRGVELALTLPEEGGVVYLVGREGQADVTWDGSGQYLVRFAASTLRRTPP